MVNIRSGAFWARRPTVPPVNMPYSSNLGHAEKDDDDEVQSQCCESPVGGGGNAQGNIRNRKNEARALAACRGWAVGAPVTDPTGAFAGAARWRKVG